MRFHVDGSRAGGRPQIGLALDGEHGRIDTGQIGGDHPRAGTGQEIEERRRQVEIGGTPPVFAHHAGADDDVTRLEGGIEPPRDAEAHNRPAAGGDARVEEVTQAMRVAAGPHRLDPLPRRHAALAGEAGDGQDGCGGIDHGALVDQSGQVRKPARTSRRRLGRLRRGTRFARSRGIAV